ncbi:ImmA/IrrE family metallo-endopeptidase [Streptococcaceae bacterium ESL0729]|nr:ImmA/IrrE family metallo-endopeptidase [Streptococcaceae bacterium ESL0729]
MKSLEELGIQIIYSDRIKEDGVYIPKVNLIVINSNLEDVDAKNALLHELGHYLNKHFETRLSAPALHIKNEAEADRYWIECRVKEFLSYYDYPPEEIDVNRFLTVYKIKPRYYDMAEELFRYYLTT